MDDKRADSFAHHEELNELLSRVAHLQTRMKKLVDMANRFQNYASEFIDPFAEDYADLYADELRLPDEAELDLAADTFELENDWDEGIYPFADAYEVPVTEAEAAANPGTNLPHAEEIPVRHVSHYRNWPSALKTGYAPPDITADEAQEHLELEMKELDVYDAVEIVPESLEPAEWMEDLASAYRSVQNFAREIQVVQAREYPLASGDPDELTLDVDSIENSESVTVQEVPVEPVPGSEVNPEAVTSDDDVEVAASHHVSAESVASLDAASQEVVSSRESVQEESVTEKLVIEESVQEETAAEKVHRGEETAKAETPDDAEPAVSAAGVAIDLSGDVEVEEATEDASEAEEVTKQVDEASVLEADTVEKQARREEKRTEGQTRDRKETHKSGVIHWSKFPPPLTRRRRG